MSALTPWTADQWAAYLDTLTIDPSEETGCDSCQ